MNGNRLIMQAVGQVEFNQTVTCGGRRRVALAYELRRMQLKLYPFPSLHCLYISTHYKLAKNWPTLYIYIYAPQDQQQ